MMARTVEGAFDYCVMYFPLEKGYIHLEIRNIDTGAIRRLMPNEYIERDGKLTPIIDGISENRQGELILHIPGCNVPLQDCPDCWEYYSNMGHDKFAFVYNAIHP
jgi:hypothetical protein